MNTQSPPCDSFQISPRFRALVEERISRLERDAESDELTLNFLENGDHIRRHRRLIIVQRTEALRMRLFLERSGNRLPRPLIAL